MKYIRGLERGTLDRQLERADGAWRRLWRDILFPGPDHVALLDVGERSRDFGRDDTFDAIPRKTWSNPLRALRELQTASWKEGYAVRAFPRAYPLVHAALQVRYLTDMIRHRP